MSPRLGIYYYEMQRFGRQHASWSMERATMLGCLVVQLAIRRLEGSRGSGEADVDLSGRLSATQG